MIEWVDEGARLVRLIVMVLHFHSFLRIDTQWTPRKRKFFKRLTNCMVVGCVNASGIVIGFQISDKYE